MLLFPAVIRFSPPDAAHACHAAIAREMGLIDYSSPDEEDVTRLLEELEVLNEELETPSLRALAVEMISSNRRSCPWRRRPSKKEILELYPEVYCQADRSKGSRATR
jgi:hypothetical protein